MLSKNITLRLIRIAQWLILIMRVVPQAAVAVVVRFHAAEKPSLPKYLLIQRGKEPNKGMWSLPGGRIEVGETTMDAAKRELFEETLGWPVMLPPTAPTVKPNLDHKYGMAWHPYPFTSSDAIFEGYHYVISQCFVNVIVPKYYNRNDNNEATDCFPPGLHPGDDAAAVDWFTLDDIRSKSQQQQQLRKKNDDISEGVVRVVERAEILFQHGLLK